MFKNATLRLTVFYVILLALISVFFSVNWYRVATTEVRRGLEGQRGALVRNFENRPFDSVLQEIRAQQIEEANRAIINNIAAANIALLSVGGYASYLLAKRTLRPIEQAHEAQARFIADASHELRTPISVMRAEIEVRLRNKSISKQTRQLLESTLEEVIGLQDLSEELLRITRIANSSEAARLTSFRVKPVIEKAVSAAMKLAKTRNIAIHTSINEAEVVAHERSIEQILTILLDNAIKYSPDKSSIKLKGRRTDGGYAITVSDRAGGIKKNERDRIFERFYRVNDKSKKNIPGSGLGLSIARELAEQAGADVSLLDSDGSGSTFQVLIKKLG